MFTAWTQGSHPQHAGLRRVSCACATRALCWAPGSCLPPASRQPVGSAAWGKSSPSLPGPQRHHEF